MGASSGLRGPSVPDGARPHRPLSRRGGRGSRCRNPVAAPRAGSHRAATRSTMAAGGPASRRARRASRSRLGPSAMTCDAAVRLVGDPAGRRPGPSPRAGRRRGSRHPGRGRGPSRRGAPARAASRRRRRSRLRPDHRPADEEHVEHELRADVALDQLARARQPPEERRERPSRRRGRGPFQLLEQRRRPAPTGSPPACASARSRARIRQASSRRSTARRRSAAGTLREPAASAAGSGVRGRLAAPGSSAIAGGRDRGGLRRGALARAGPARRRDRRGRRRLHRGQRAGPRDQLGRRSEARRPAGSEQVEEDPPDLAAEPLGVGGRRVRDGQAGPAAHEAGEPGRRRGVGEAALVEQALDLARARPPRGAPARSAIAPSAGAAPRRRRTG